MDDIRPHRERDVRAAEDALRIAFLNADVDTLDRLLADGYVVNSPLQKVLDKAMLLELMRAGRIRHTAFEIDIERVIAQADTVIVMGRDSVTDPPDGVVSLRRFTNVWQMQDGEWRSIARHAHVVSRRPET
jgi:hypothetical protein